MKEKNPAAGASVRMARRVVPGLLFSIPILFLAVFLAYPLGRIFAIGIPPVFAQGLARIASRTGLGRLLASNALQALASTGLCLAVGLPAAYVFARYDFPGKRMFHTLLTIPFVMPTVVVGAGFIALLGPDGPLGRLFGLLGGSFAESGLLRTLPAVLLAHVFYNVSLVVRIVGGFWSTLDPKLRETAEVLGAGRLASFLRVTGRLLLPSIAASAILVFSFCFTSFGVILILGGPRIGTLETEIYRQAVSFFDIPAAAFLSLVQLVFTALLMAGYSRLQARMSVAVSQVASSRTARKPRSAGERALVILFGYLFTAGLILPLAALAVESFHGRNGFSLTYWKGLFVNIRNSIFWSSPFSSAGRSLLYAFLAVIMSLAVGLPASYLVARPAGKKADGRKISAVLDVLFLLPLGTSAVTLGFGFIISLDRPPLDLRSSLLIIPIAHALAALPLVTRSLIAPLSGIEPGLREAASVLGAGRLRTRLEVDAPILRHAIVTAAAFAFTVSLGEFAATALLTRPELATIPVMIYQYLGQPGDLNQGCALAMSTILMVVCGLGLAVIERARVPGTEVF